MSETSGKYLFATIPTALLYHDKITTKALRLFDRIDFLSNNKKGYIVMPRMTILATCQPSQRRQWRGT